MRSSKNLKMMTTDLKKIQKSEQQKVEKEIQSIIQLIDLPDFDVSQLFQTVLKSGHQDQILQGIPQEKLIDFLSRNFSSYIETQDQLAQLKLPVLEQIPKAKTFYFQDLNQKQKQQNPDQSSAIEIVDSFSTSVLEKNNQQILRILNIIREMRNHTKYKQYFDNFNVAKLYRQSYQTFIETCDDCQILLQIGQVAIALKKFLKEKLSNFIASIRTDVNVDCTNRGVKKIMNKVVSFIEQILREVKEKYSADKFVNPLEGDTIMPKFLSQLCHEFYQVVEPCVYEKEQLLQVLEALDIILDSFSELESKGINLTRQLRSLIALDLPSHMNKIVQVVLEAFEDILKDENRLYELKYFDGLSSLGSELDLLHEIRPGQYGKKCCSQKGILLINSFTIILQPLCDQKWQFLLENVLQQLVDKVKNAITNSNWHYWDYYQLFYFFDKMKSGKIKNKKLYRGQDPPVALIDKFNTLKKLSYECWEIFQTKITTEFWLKILSRIPDLLCQIRGYIAMKQPSSMKPTVFSIDLIFSMDDFLKQITFRLQKQQYNHLVSRLFEYVLYVIEYLIYRAYHHKGSNEKVFTLYKKSDKILKKAKIFAIQQLESMKENKKISKIQDFTKIGVQNMALDLYFFTEVMKILTEYEKFNCDNEVEKMAQIQAKQHKTQPTKVQKSKFKGGLQKFLKIFQQQPEKIRNYLISKRKDNKSVQ